MYISQSLFTRGVANAFLALDLPAAPAAATLPPFFVLVWPSLVRTTSNV